MRYRGPASLRCGRSCSAAGSCWFLLRRATGSRLLSRSGATWIRGSAAGCSSQTATTTPWRCSPTLRRRSSAPARSAMTCSRSCHEGRRGSSRSPFLSWLPTSASVTRSCWCWTTFTSSRPKRSRSIIEFLAEQVPSGSQLVLVRRGDPGVRLGRLRASGDLVEVGAALLALDAEETRAVAALGGLELSEEAAEALRERTEGWAAAVALAALSLRDRDDAATRAAETDRHSAADRRLPPGRGAWRASRAISRRSCSVRRSSTG